MDGLPTCPDIRGTNGPVNTYGTIKIVVSTTAGVANVSDLVPKFVNY